MSNRQNILRPIYVRAMINAMRDQVKAKNFDKLEQWFPFCEWVLSHSDPRNEHPYGVAQLWDRSRVSPRWHTARRAVCNFVEACLEHNAEVPAHFRVHLVTILGLLCTQYDWLLDRDDRTPLNRDDQLTEAINTTRGCALENLVKFGLWIRRQDSKADVPELKAILEKRFGSEAAYPLTIPEYVILGRLYRSIFDLDKHWASDRKSILFPQHNFAAWRGAFGSLLRYNHPDKAVFEYVRDDFEFALNHLDRLRDRENVLGNLTGIIGEHLFSYYTWGVFPLVGAGSLLNGFYKASDGKREHWATLFNYVGHSLRKAGNQLENGSKDRIVTFFEWRLKTEEALELRKFSEWFEAECLDTEWRLDALSRVLKIRGILNETKNLRDGRDDDPETRLPHDATRQLRAMLPEHTPRVVGCFAKLTDVLPRSGGFYIPADDAKAILKAGLEHNDERVRKNAERAQEKLFSQGILRHSD